MIDRALSASVIFSYHFQTRSQQNPHPGGIPWYHPDFLSFWKQILVPMVWVTQTSREKVMIFGNNPNFERNWGCHFMKCLVMFTQWKICVNKELRHTKAGLRDMIEYSACFRKGRTSCAILIANKSASRGSTNPNSDIVLGAKMKS